jgi:hypothetical protein
MLSTVRLLLAVCLAFVAPAFGADLPTPSLTPGVVRPGITADDLCPVAHTGQVRNVTAADKRAVFQSYGLAGNHTGYCDVDGGCEIDHLISLELGGANDRENLWPQPYSGTVWNARVKDKLEDRLHRMVCAGTITLQSAQQEIASDWIGAYRRYIGDP